MTKLKKMKSAPETPVDVVDEVKEKVVSVESEARRELRRIYAVSKANNPELYAIQNKDAKLEKELRELK